MPVNDPAATSVAHLTGPSNSGPSDQSRRSRRKGRLDRQLGEERGQKAGRQDKLTRASRQPHAPIAGHQTSGESPLPDAGHAL
jgi:hypothetical protein